MNRYGYISGEPRPDFIVEVDRRTIVCHHNAPKDKAIEAMRDQAEIIRQSLGATIWTEDEIVGLYNHWQVVFYYQSSQR